MKYYKDGVSGEVFSYSDGGSQDHLIGDKVLMTALEVEAHINPPKTQEQLLQEMEDGVQNLLDTEAQSLGYDNIVSACSYMGSLNFGAEAQSFLDWRDACWSYCYTQLGYTQLLDTDINYRTLPTTEELLLELPTRVI